KRTTVFENQFFVCIRISRKPELAIDVFTVSLYSRKLVLFGFRNTLALGLHDLEVLIVNPDSSREQTFLYLLGIRHHFRLHVEDKKVEFIYLLFTGISDGVFVNFRRLERQWFPSSQILNILCRYLWH